MPPRKATRTSRQNSPDTPEAFLLPWFPVLKENGSAPSLVLPFFLFTGVAGLTPGRTSLRAMWQKNFKPVAEARQKLKATVEMRQPRA
jgi:hypothetical protein